MDAKTVNQTYDLLSLAESETKLTRAGAYYIGPCPFCGGKDRFNLKKTDSGWRWLCRRCTDAQYKTPIDYKMRRDNQTFQEALEALGGNANFSRRASSMPPLSPAPQPYSPPSSVWQARALRLAERAQSVLWSERGCEALAWLRARGLRDETIRAARLGYIPKNPNGKGYFEKATLWGSPRESAKEVYIPDDVILIPGIIAGQVWYLKSRYLRPSDHKEKYAPQIRGSQSAALYGAETLAQGKPAVLCEGEFDALLLKQEINDLAGVVTLGSATNDLNLLTWGLCLLRPSRFIVGYDADQAGAAGGKKFAWLRDVVYLNVPALRAGDKDFTDFHKSGGNLRSLIESVMREDAQILVTWAQDAKPATMRGQYRKTENGIEARYAPDDLRICLETMRTIAA